MHFNFNFKRNAFLVVISAFLVASSALVFQACQKSNDNIIGNGDDQGGYASDASRIEWANDDVISIADAAGEVYNGAFMRTTHTTGIGACCTVGTDTVSNPHTLVIRFGSSDCVCLDGRSRKGTIIVSYNGEYSDPGQIHTITFDNYYVNDNQLTGSITTTRVDTTIAGNWYYKVASHDSMNISQDPLNSQYVVWAGSFVRKWVQGYTTGDRGDDIFSISGEGLLTRPDGNAFSFNIATPMQIAMGCNFCESGVVNVNGYQGSRVLNYGAGTCDANAQLTIGVHIYELTLTP
jgi:hypothetical protein